MNSQTKCHLNYRVTLLELKPFGLGFEQSSSNHIDHYADSPKIDSYRIFEPFPDMLLSPLAFAYFSTFGAKVSQVRTR